MKQFSLEEYLKNPEKKVVTRDGRNVRIRCTDRRGSEGLPIAAWVETSTRDGEILCRYREDGLWCPSGEECNLDLFFAIEREE